MKKLLFTTAALAGFVIQSFGQGEVLFANTANQATRIYINSNGVSSTDQSAGISGGTQTPANSTLPLMYALFAAPNAVNNVVGNPWTDPNWAFSGNYGTNTQAAGRLTGMGPYAATGSGGVVIPGFAVGSSAALLLIGWDVARGGNTLSSFIQAYDSGTLGLIYGRSGIGHIVLGNGSTPPDTTLFGTVAGQLGGFTMAPNLIPEPTSFALAGLGAAALLIFRRRR